MRSIVALARQNPAYRRLWAAQAVSLVGDWFTLIALSVIVSRQTGRSGLAFAGLLLTHLVPAAVIGPMAGVLVDRFDRKRLLVASDLVRALLVALMIGVLQTGLLWPVYAIAFLHYTVSTVFEPARSALLPRIVGMESIVAAQTMSSVTWSVMAAMGGVLGGTLVALVGTEMAFAIDGLTFLISAAFLVGIHVPGGAAARPEPGALVGERLPPVRFMDGIRYLRAHPPTLAALLVKGMNGLGTTDTFLTIYATRLFVEGADGAVSLGLLWASFGVGAFIGPVGLNLVNDGSVHRMRRLIAVGALWITVSLFVLGVAPSLAVAGLAIALRGIGGSVTWTYSVIVLQKSVPDRLRGRIFALDLANVQLLSALCAVLTGWAVDAFPVRRVVLTSATINVLPVVAWILALPWMDRRGRSEVH